MKIKKLHIVFIIIVWFLNPSFSQSIQNISLNNSNSLDLEKDWEFYAYDSLSLLDSSFTGKTRIVNSLFNFDSLLNESPSEIIWFKKRIKTDSSFASRSITFNVKLVGTAEIFINKIKVKSFGNMNVFEKENVFVSDHLNFSYAFEPNTNYDISVRYGNYNINETINNNGGSKIGFKLVIEQTASYYENFIGSIIPNYVLGTILGMFFLTLAFVHFILFLFYKKEKANLLYSLFCFTFTLLIMVLVVGQAFDTLEYVPFLYKLSQAFSSLFLLLLPFMLSSFFKFKRGKWQIIFVILSSLLILNLFIDVPYEDIILITLAISSSIFTLKLLYLGIKRKIHGAKYIAIGIIVFFIFVISLTLAAMNMHVQINTGNTFFGLIFFILILLSIVSIPISITVFLAAQISHTNHTLSNKLIEVEELSVKSIEQEREKQRYLENQKQVLEEQVVERTHEITEQKQIIEDKNKDIIDSINYAKRIQTSILPTVDYFNTVFTNAFIFFQPRDIVSGDFYYVTEINNSKLLFCADCTGHGVPGALMSMVGSNLIHKIIHEHKIFEPKLILETLHRELRSSLKQDVLGSDNRDGMDACLVIIKDNELIYSGANRPLFYFDKENNLHEIKATKTPIGGSHIDSVSIAQHTINRDSIKEFYVFSDGFADQFGGPSGKKLMVSRFKQWLTDIQQLNSIEKKDFIETEFIKWKSNLEQVDDVMVIGVAL